MPDPATSFDATAWRQRLRVAQGLAPADLVLAGGTIVDVLSGDTFDADVAIADGVIAGVGSYPQAQERLDVTGRWVCPSFIDAHVHTESALVWLPEFARAVVPHGTGAVVTDPHEIANVDGLAGMEAMRAAARGLPLGIYFTVPSCVPASPWESAGAEFGPAEMAEMLGWPECVGLGELMNFPGVLAGDDDIARKLAASAADAATGTLPACVAPHSRRTWGRAPVRIMNRRRLTKRGKSCAPGRW